MVNLRSKGSQIGNQLGQLPLGQVTPVRVTEDIQNLSHGAGGTVVKKVVALTYAVQGRRIEFLEPGFIMKSDVIFVGGSQERAPVTLVATEFAEEKFPLGDLGAELFATSCR